MFPKQTCLSLSIWTFFSISAESSTEPLVLSTSFGSSKSNGLRVSNEGVKNKSESGVDLCRVGLIFEGKDYPEFHFGPEMITYKLLGFQTSVVRNQNHKKHEVTRGLSKFVSDVAAKPNLCGCQDRLEPCACLSWHVYHVACGPCQCLASAKCVSPLQCLKWFVLVLLELFKRILKNL